MDTEDRKFNGMTLLELEHMAVNARKLPQALEDLVIDYMRIREERDQLQARINLLRAAARGGM